MSRQSNQNERTISYLLGTLSDEERALMEERFFSDDAEFEELEIAEDELIDSYVRGTLSTAQSRLFEERMVDSPRLVQRVEFARAWANRMAAPVADSSTNVAPLHDKEGTWWSRLFGLSGAPRGQRFAPAFAVLLLVVVGAALFVGWLKWKESKRLAAEQAALEQRQRELEKQATDLKPNQIVNQTSPVPTPIQVASPQRPVEPAPGPSAIALALSPGATRGGAGTSIRITPATSQVAFTLKVNDTDYSSYQATLQTVERTTVWTSGGLRLRRSGSGPTLSFTIPAKRLQPADYIVDLDGITSTGTKMNRIHYYVFRVTR